MGVLKSLRATANQITCLPGFKGTEFDQFRLHLTQLDLLGIEFTLVDYLDARATFIGRDIHLVDAWKDQHDRLLHSHQLSEGAMGFCARNEKLGHVEVGVRESLKLLPWPTYELHVYHEIMHHVCDHKPDEHVSQRMHEMQEKQANTWASWALLASSEPQLFSSEAVDTVT